MIKTELIEILQLLLTEGIGPVTFYKYLQTYGNVEKALKVLSSKKKICSKEKAEDYKDVAGYRVSQLAYHLGSLF